MAQQPKRKPGRPASVTIVTGQMFGLLVIRGRVKTKDGAKWRTECLGRLKDGTICGKKELVPTQYLTRKANPKTNCGCQTYKDANPHKYEKVCWQTMHTRCEWYRHVSYAVYGGRGIKIDPRWSKDRPDGKGFENFIQDIGLCPQPHKMTVDRIDPNGHYTKGNVRWATKKQQANNQRKDLVVKTDVVPPPPKEWQEERNSWPTNPKSIDN